MKNLAPWSHEEADTHLLLHVVDAAQKGYRNPCVCPVDTDIVTLAIAMLNKVNPDELWFAIGTGSNFHSITIHVVASDTDLRICTTLPVFHAFAGCDTVSVFGSRGKMTA